MRAFAESSLPQSGGLSMSHFMMGGSPKPWESVKEEATAPWLSEATRGLFLIERN